MQISDTQNNTLGNVGAWGAYDASRVALWKDYSDHIWAIDSDFYVILEHFADNSEETELAEYGMMIWQNMNHDYTEISMGYPAGITWASYKNRGWTVPHNIVYMESHDEQRVQYKNENFGNSSGGYNIKVLETGLERLILAATFMYTIPGPKMLWQFGELGYDHDIDLNGRTGNKPIRWDYYDVTERRTVNQAFSYLINLKTGEPAFGSSDFVIEEEGQMKRIRINHADMDVRVLGNFNVSSGFLSGEFSKTGYWYEFFTGDSLEVTNTSELLTLQPGEYRLYTTKRFDKPTFAVGLDDLLAKTYDNSWFNIYPNPASDLITIDADAESGGFIDRIRVLGLDGRVIMDIDRPGDNRLDLSTLDRGIYLLSVTTGKRTGTKRILKVN